ncbi:MAG: coproporphyrinogen III oxidase, partial [Thermodesulfobacteriota bacterium]
KAFEAGEVVKVPETCERDMYLSAIELLKGAGYLHYEVSNFALPGNISKHNSAYWKRQAYIGLGAGAHSSSFGDNTERWWNENEIEGYMRSVEERGSARAAGEELSREAEKLEAVYLGLRVLKGIDIGAFRTRFGADPRELLSKAALGREFLTTDDRGMLKLTQKGLLFSDSLF